MEKGAVSTALVSLALFILFSLGAVIYLYNQNQQLRRLIPTPTPELSATASPTPAVEPSVTATASASAKPVRTPVTVKPPTGEAVACTMDAKVCPDGSSVGRVPPNCQFAPCPTP